MVTVMKPISEVINYVTDASTWSEWGINFTQAMNIGANIIEATYHDSQKPPKEFVIRWSINLSPIGESQLLTFTNTASPAEMVTYTLTPGDNGTSTSVERNDPTSIGLPGDISPALLANLQGAIEKRI